MRRVLARAVSRVAATLDATTSLSSSSRASFSRASSPTGPDGASRAPRPRARVDARTLPRPPPRATDADADDAREEEETDDLETIARAHAEKRRAYHAARGMDVLEIGGPAGPLEPTRYGDWERGGRASDF